jgi:putative DNA primase/helicase
VDEELSPVEKVLDRLKDYKDRKDEYRARCPAHNGNSDDSLSIKEGDDGRALLTCHAHCETKDILGALDLSMADLFVKGKGHSSPGAAKKGKKATRSGEKKHKILTTDELPDGTYWEFTSPAGEVLYIQRHKREYYRKVGEDRWVTYKGVLDDIAQVPYGLPELIDGVRAGKTVYHVEGPKDVETARKRLGVVATTSGSTSSWRPEFRTHYMGADVVVISDNDDPGRKYAEAVAQDLLKVAKSVKVVHLSDLPEGGDLTDWLDSGHPPEELFTVVEETEIYAPEEEEPWPEPGPIEVKLPDVMEFDPSLLPSPLRGWVKDVSERMDNAPPDFAAAATVVVAAALLGRKVGIRPKRQDDWTVVPNLWGGLVGPPASMKTPALEQAIKPVKRLAA